MKVLQVAISLLCLSSLITDSNAGLLGRTDRPQNQTEWQRQLTTSQSHGVSSTSPFPNFPASNIRHQTIQAKTSGDLPRNTNILKQQIHQNISPLNTESQSQQVQNAELFHYQLPLNRGSQFSQTPTNSAIASQELRTNFKVSSKPEHLINQSSGSNYKNTNSSPLGYVSNLDTSKARKVPLVLITIHKPRGSVQKSKTRSNNNTQNQKSTNGETSDNVSNFQIIPDQGSYGQDIFSTRPNSVSAQPSGFENNVQSALRSNENINTQIAPSDKNFQIKTDNFGSNQWYPIDRNRSKVSAKINSGTQENNQPKNYKTEKNDAVEVSYQRNSTFEKTPVIQHTTSVQEMASFVRKPIMNHDARTLSSENSGSTSNYNRQNQPAVFVVLGDRNQPNKAQQPYEIPSPSTRSMENPQNTQFEDSIGGRQQSVGIQTHVSTAEVVHFPSISTQSQNSGTPHLSVINTHSQAYYNIDSLRSNDGSQKRVLIPAIIEQKTRDKYESQRPFQTGGQHPHGNNNLRYNLPQQIISNDHSDSSSSSAESNLSGGRGNNYLSMNNLNKILGSSQMQQLLTLALEQNGKSFQNNFNNTLIKQQNQEIDNGFPFQRNLRNLDSEVNSLKMHEIIHSQQQNTSGNIVPYTGNKPSPSQHVIFPNSNQQGKYNSDDESSLFFDQRTLPHVQFNNGQEFQNSNDKRNPIGSSETHNHDQSFNQLGSMVINAKNNYNSNENLAVSTSMASVGSERKTPNDNIDPRQRNEQTQYSTHNTHFMNEFSQTLLNDQKDNIGLDARKLSEELESPKVSSDFLRNPLSQSAHNQAQKYSTNQQLEYNNEGMLGDNEHTKIPKNIFDEYKPPTSPTVSSNGVHNQAQQYSINPQFEHENKKDVSRFSGHTIPTDNENGPSTSLKVSNNRDFTHIYEGNQKSSVPEALLLVLVSAQRSLESESEIKNHNHQLTSDEYADQEGQESMVLRSILEAAGRQYRKESDALVPKNTGRRGIVPLSG